MWNLKNEWEEWIKYLIFFVKLTNQFDIYDYHSYILINNRENHFDGELILDLEYFPKYFLGLDDDF